MTDDWWLIQRDADVNADVAYIFAVTILMLALWRWAEWKDWTVKASLGANKSKSSPQEVPVQQSQVPWLEPSFEAKLEESSWIRQLAAAVTRGLGSPQRLPGAHSLDPQTPTKFSSRYLIADSHWSYACPYGLVFVGVIEFINPNAKTPPFQKLL